jgi:hypothetical protein
VQPQDKGTRCRLQKPPRWQKRANDAGLPEDGGAVLVGMVAEHDPEAALKLLGRQARYISRSNRRLSAQRAGEGGLARDTCENLGLGEARGTRHDSLEPHPFVAIWAARCVGRRGERQKPILSLVVVIRANSGCTINNHGPRYVHNFAPLRRFLRASIAPCGRKAPNKALQQGITRGTALAEAPRS